MFANPVTGNTLILSSSVTVPTTFLSIFGYHALGATTSSTITRATSGLEVALVLDNTFSMTEDTTDNVEALLALKQATYEFINELWTQNATSDALSPAPAAIPGLYVGVVPFVAQVNVLNTTSDATVGTKKYELLGSDANTKVSDIVNITSTGLTQPLCGYNGNWTPSSDDQVAPLDLIHLAQDLCVKYITTVNSSTGVEGFSGAPAWGSYYLVDDLNSSALSGYAWGGLRRRAHHRGRYQQHALLGSKYSEPDRCGVRFRSYGRERGHAEGGRKRQDCRLPLAHLPAR